MLLTEDEAKKKWCPFARTVERYDGFNSSPRNRVAQVEGDNALVLAADLTGVQCIASGCAAWRAGIYDHQRNLSEENRTPGVGYCGLAGRPS